MPALKPVYILDLFIQGPNHVVVNTAITGMVAEIFRNRKVIFIAEQRHAALVKENSLTRDQISLQSYVELPLPQSRQKRALPWLVKKIADIRLIARKFAELRGSEPEFIFFTCLSTTPLCFVNFYSRFFRNIQVVFFLHGEIEYIFQPDIGYLNSLKGILYRKVLTGLSRNARCVVFSPLIRNRLIQRSLIRSNQITAIEHPVLDAVLEYSPLSASGIAFGHIGTALRLKNSEAFFRLAQECVFEIDSSKAVFILAGRVGNGKSPDPESRVLYYSADNRPVPQHEFERYIRQIDYAVFTFTEENYLFRASGSLMDAFNFGKPIIAISQDYIDHFFMLGGNIGFRCADHDEMRTLIKRLIEREPVLVDQYYEQQHNLKKMRMLFTVEALAPVLRQSIRV